MNSFAYRAVHPSGRIQKGHMLAANENELAFYLHQLNLELIEATPQKQNPLLQRFRAWQDNIDLRARQTLCSQLADMLRAGLPFAEALALVIEATPSGPFQSRLMAIAQDVKSGQDVAAAFARQNQLFDTVFLGLLEAGERAGDLTTTFERLSQHLRKQHHFQRMLRRALRYPLFLLAVAFGVTSFMMLLVVPEVIAFLTSLGHDLPLPTRLLLGAADLFSALWAALPFIVGSLYLGLRWARKHSAQARLKTDHILLRLPILGRLVRTLALARFTASLSILLGGQLSVPQALGIALSGLGNLHLMAQAQEAQAQLVAGRALSRALNELLPPMALQMIKVGEQSGTLSKAVETVARTYEQDSQDAVESFLGALEPALTLLVGSLLAWVVLAVLGPIYGALGPLARGM